MKIKPYTPKELTGKFICSFPVSFPPYLDCVRCNAGRRAGMPYLYNSVKDAENDEFYDEVTDKIIPASEYYKLTKEIKPKLSTI